jgi:hypothetical protein
MRVKQKSTKSSVKPLDPVTNADDEVLASSPTFCGLPLVTAPKAPRKEKGMGTQVLLHKVLPGVLEIIITGKDVPVKELAEKVGMKSPNYIGTATGHGKGGGLQMWKTGSAIMACKENAAIAMKFLYGDCPPDDRIERVAADLSMGEEELQEAFDKLPTADARKREQETQKFQEELRSAAKNDGY